MKISLRSRTSWQQRARPQKEKTTDKYVCATVHMFILNIPPGKLAT